LEARSQFVISAGGNPEIAQLAEASTPRHWLWQ